MLYEFSQSKMPHIITSDAFKLRTRRLRPFNIPIDLLGVYKDSKCVTTGDYTNWVTYFKKLTDANFLISRLHPS